MFMDAYALDELVGQHRDELMADAEAWRLAGCLPRYSPGGRRAQGQT